MTNKKRLKRTIRKFRHIIEYFFAVILFYSLRFFPVSALYFSASLTGKIMYYFIPVRKKVMRENIKRVFKTISDAELKKILKKSYANICKSAFEYFIFSRLTGANLYKFGFIENKRHIDEVLNSGNGAVLLGAHFDNPELTTNILKLSGIKICAIVKKQRNSYVSDLLEKIRTHNGIEIFYKNNYLKTVYKRLKENYALATVADIAVPDPEGITLDFCGYQLPTAAGPAMFAIRTNAAVIPVFSVRLNDNTHKIIVCERIDANIDSELDNKQKIKTIMQRYNDLLEKKIREYPDQWFWMHNRWKYRK
ncbi:MAG TPA: lysophospholipid acyltransferase family protein [bacterium]|nr:lysophospholipid acyltransferase family protein [bacterium]HPN30465.1 lysophospholipid acyltransferase family protein [bacterium]